MQRWKDQRGPHDFSTFERTSYPSVSFFQIREIDNDVLFRDMLMSWGLSDAGCNAPEVDILFQEEKPFDAD